MEKKEIAVGDSTRLEIIFSTKTYRTRITKKPRITTNAGTTPKQVEIISQVTPRPDSTYPLIIGPYKLDLSQYSDKVIHEKSFDIYNASDQELEFTLVSFPPEFFNVKLPKSVKPDQTVTAKIMLTDSGLEENFSKSLTFQVNDERLSRYTVPVKRNVRKVGPPKSTAKVTGK